MFKSILKRDKFFWISYIITILACFGFTLTNFSVGIDDEIVSEYINGGSLIMQGRPGEPLLSHIFNVYEFLPFWHDFIAILIITLSILFWIFLFENASDNNFDNKHASIFACIAVSFPIIAKSFIFTISTIGFGLCFLLSGITLIFFNYAVFETKNNKIRNYSLAFIFSLFALLIGENSAVILVIGFFMILLLQSDKSENHKCLIEYFIIFVKFVFMIILSLIIRKIIAISMINIYNYTKFDYTSSFIMHDFQNLALSIVKATKSIIFKFFINKTTDINIIMYRISAIAICLFMISRFVKKRNIYLLLFGVGLILSPLALCFISGNTSLPDRTLIPLSYFAGFSLSILYTTVKNIKIGKVNIKYFIYVLVFYIVLYQSKEMNVIFFNDYLNYKLDVEKMNTIMHDLQKESNGNLTKPVVFIGIPPNYNLDYSKTQLNSIFKWDRSNSPEEEFSGRRIRSFINMHGYNVQAPTNYDEKKIRQVILGMTMYPADGYIKDYGDYFIVKLGEALYECSNLNTKEFEKQFEDSVDVPISLWIDGLSYENELLTMNGWAVINNLPSKECLIKIVLSGKNNQYIISTHVNGGSDITAYMGDGTDYDGSRFLVYNWNTSVVEPGNYEVNLIIQSKNQNVYTKTGKNILVN